MNPHPFPESHRPIVLRCSIATSEKDALLKFGYSKGARGAEAFDGFFDAVTHDDVRGRMSDIACVTAYEVAKVANMLGSEGGVTAGPVPGIMLRRLSRSYYVRVEDGSPASSIVGMDMVHAPVIIVHGDSQTPLPSDMISKTDQYVAAQAAAAGGDETPHMMDVRYDIMCDKELANTDDTVVLAYCTSGGEPQAVMQESNDAGFTMQVHPGGPMAGKKDFDESTSVLLAKMVLARKVLMR